MKPDRSKRTPPDWEAIEADYRAGVKSVREIARKYGISDTAIRKRAIEFGWERALADKVRAKVREKLVRSEGSQPQRVRTDAEIIEENSLVGYSVVTSHRVDIIQLHALKRILATRLATILQGGEADGLCLGERESPGDLLEKLSRVSARLIPLERQAHNLDDAPADIPSKIGAAVMAASKFEEIARRVTAEF